MNVAAVAAAAAKTEQALAAGLESRVVHQRRPAVHQEILAAEGEIVRQVVRQ